MRVTIRYTERDVKSVTIEDVRNETDALRKFLDGLGVEKTNVLILSVVDADKKPKT